MATENQIRRILENALGLTANSLNGPLNAGDSVVERIGGVNDRVNVVETEVSSRVPKFAGKEEEDVEEWIAQVEALFTASGRNAGGNNARIAQFAIGGLEGAALQWYTERKAGNAGHLVNWADVDNDNDLKHRIKQRFIGDEVRRRKLQELQYIKQKSDESIDKYTLRFKKVLRMAKRGINMPDVLEVEYFVKGLKGELVEQVRLDDPATLEAVITRARMVERVKNETLQQEVMAKVNEQGIGEVLKSFNIANKITQEMVINKPVEQSEIDDLTKQLERLEVKNLQRKIRNLEQQVNFERNNNENIRRNVRNNINNQQRSGNRNQSVITCYDCGQDGHYVNKCPLRRRRRVNFTNQIYDDRDYDGYSNNSQYEQEYYNDNGNNDN
jgi:hypothetical protein